MTTRDRMVLAVVVLIAVVGGAWFTQIAPKRDEAGRLAAQVQAKRGELSAAQAAAAGARQAKEGFRSDLAAVVGLGKAVPADDDVPSLVYQIDTAAEGHGIDFRKLKLEAGAGGGAPAAAPPAAQAAAIGQASGTGPTGATGPAGAAAAPAAPAAVPATQSAAAGLPPGAAVGSAGLPTLPFSFTFDGSFFGMQRFFRELDRLVRLDGGGIDVRGRLVSIDSFSLSASRNGFPDVSASVGATTFVLPDAQGATAGATPAGPAPAVPVSAPAPTGSR